MGLKCSSLASVKGNVILTGFYPDNGHQVEKDFGVLLAKTSTDEE